MRIQILSDLHLEIERRSYPEGREFYHYEIPVEAESLALLGDIGCTVDDQLFSWLRIQLTRFKMIFYVMGNHGTWYGSHFHAAWWLNFRFSRAVPVNYRMWLLLALRVDFILMHNESHARLSTFASEIDTESQSPNSQLGQFIFLNRTRFDVSPTLTFLGCTLWSALKPEHMNILSWVLTDFHRIGNFNPDAYVALHQGDLAWLNATVTEIQSTEPERVIVVFTHHAPSISGTGDPKFDGVLTSSAFATELTEEVVWTSGNVKVWAFGHTHWGCDFERNGVRVYSNQRGRGEGRDDFDPTKTVILPG